MPQGICNDGSKVGRRNRSALRENNAFLKGGGKYRVNGKSHATTLSPWAESLKFEYHAQGLDTWTNSKVFDCCRMFHCTLNELCAWAGEFDRSHVTRWRNLNRWPIYLTLHFDRLVRYKLALRGAGVQDAMAAKGFDWKNEEEKAA